jgi:hypothetical protein
MKPLFEVTFRVSIMPDGYSYAAEVLILAQDPETAQEQARKWFQKEQPYHKSDTNSLTATLDNFHVVELPSFLCYGVGDMPSRWHLRDHTP